MMSLLAAERLSKKFNDQIILDTVSFTITIEDRIALVGKNGMGKTTLLEIIAGKQEPDDGLLNRARSLAIDYVEQEKTDYLTWTLWEFIEDARRDLLDIRHRMNELEHRLFDAPHDTAALDELGRLQQQFEKLGGFEFETEIKVILDGLGFDPARFDERLSNFSGGEKNRAGLARVLAGRGNLLLLDEPTNHLDIESTIWLEDYLKSLPRACLIVSHDRTFLNNTVGSVWELVHGKIDLYQMRFEKYLTERVARRAQMEKAFEIQKEEIRRAEDFIRRNMAGQKTKQAQSKLKYLNKLKRLPPPRSDSRGPSINIESSGRSFAHVMRAEDLMLGYGERTVLGGVTFDLYRGEKVGLIGRNGSGKSTLLKALIGEIEPLGGELNLGNNLEVAYFDQELGDLDHSLMALDSLWECDPTADVGSIRSYLARFGLVGEDALKSISALSGGEKTKLSLARLFYHPANLIILDEPTNHLDMFAREALESAIKEYEGTCVIVSHDRSFLGAVVDKILHVSDGRVRVYNGGYDYFREKITQETSPAKKVKAAQPTSVSAVQSKDDQKKRAKLRKELLAMQSKRAEIEAELVRVEQAIRSEIPSHQWEELHKASKRKKELEESALDLYDKIETAEAALGNEP